ncbi:MAG: hypothetical protein JOY54_00710 [Acidobacteriaceae bacterium]|nr:hypothetical protein [Acidobacteriaceae bacterium]
MLRIEKNTVSLLLTGIALGCGVTGPAFGQVQNLDDASARGSLAIFADFAKYPPESRPLNSSNWDLLHPWLTEGSLMSLLPVATVRQLELLQNSGLSDDEIAQRVTMPSSLPRYQFDVNKTILAGTQDTLRAKLTVTPADELNTPVRIHVVKTELIGDDYFGSPSLGSVPFSCDSANATCTFEWTAPSADKKYWGGLQLNVTLTVEGIEDEYLAQQSFYSSPMVAGKFTGSFNEHLENGSLVIDVGVDVQKRMACFVTGNLYSVDKAVPAVFVQRRMIVDPSMKFISLTFFGKIFRDYGYSGAFRLQDLKAQCENLPYPPEWFMDSLAHQAELQAFQNKQPATMEPPRIYFEYSEYSYLTHGYSNASFSDEEWQSPTKTRKLEMLKKAAADLDDPALQVRKHP